MCPALLCLFLTPSFCTEIFSFIMKRTYNYIKRNWQNIKLGLLMCLFVSFDCDLFFSLIHLCISAVGIGLVRRVISIEFQCINVMNQCSNEPKPKRGILFILKTRKLHSVFLWEISFAFASRVILSIVPAWSIIIQLAVNDGIRCSTNRTRSHVASNKVRCDNRHSITTAVD